MVEFYGRAVFPTRNICQTRTLPRSMQDPVIKNHGRIMPENGTRFIPDIYVVHARS